MGLGLVVSCDRWIALALLLWLSYDHSTTLPMAFGSELIVTVGSPSISAMHPYHHSSTLPMPVWRALVVTTDKPATVRRCHAYCLPMTFLHSNPFRSLPIHRAFIAFRWHADAGFVRPDVQSAVWLYDGVILHAGLCAHSYEQQSRSVY
jgi:hypothetical protein